MAWWTEALNEHSPLQIALVQWVPVLITVLLGGLFASIIFPRWQDRYIAKKSIVERRQQLRENIAAQVNIYVTCWMRLVRISTHEKTLVKTGKDAEHLSTRKQLFVAQRGEARDRLIEELSRYRVYASKEEEVLINDFLMWDDDQASKLLHEIPTEQEWKSWSDRLISALR